MHLENIKPCIALMGEFSAGKSTLANLLIGANPLPVKIVATQLPPVRISYGKDAPFAVAIDGSRAPISLENINDVDLKTVAYVHIFCEEELLEHCDLIDMPGISDPNMDPEVIDRVLDQAQAVLWCSHAVQAWRQSEAATWAGMNPDLYHRSLLLLTQIDKVPSLTDRARIIKRVKRETAGLFRDVLPISLLIAMEEQDDYSRWSESGAEALVAALVALLAELNVTGSTPDAVRVPGLAAPEQPPDPNAPPRVMPRRVVRDQAGEYPSNPARS